MNVNMVVEMFEELKLQLKQLNTKIEQQAKKDNKADPELPFETIESSNDDSIEQLTELIEDVHRVQMNKMVSVHNLVYNYQNAVSSNFDEVKTIIAEKSHLYHQHNIEIKSPKVIITIVFLILTTVGCFTYNIIQYIENKSLQNNDLKYRYIKAFGGMDREKIHFLEEVFNDNANEERYEKYTNKVIDFEYRLQERARKIEEARNKEQHGKLLIKEAEKIRKQK